MLRNIAMLTVFGAVSYVQSVLFTWQSRARNQNDVKQFVKANLCAQAAYFVMQVTMLGTLWKALTSGDPWLVVATGVVFVTVSNFSAVRTMKYLISKGR